MTARLSGQALLAERARALAKPRATERAGVRDQIDLLVFFQGEERLAVPLAAVSAIVRAPVITPLPRAVAPVYGVTVLRGRALTVLSMGSIAAAPAPEQCIVVIGDGHHVTIGLLVSAVEETRVVDRETLAPAPAGSAHRVSLGLTSDAVLVLDTDALLRAV